MKFLPALLAGLMIVGCSNPQLAVEPAVTIEDPTFAADIRKQLGLADGQPILRDAAAKIEKLQLSFGGRLTSQGKTLAGFEQLTGLVELEMNNTEVRDLTPLTGLPKLKRLNIAFCMEIPKNPGPLLQLKHLEWLHIGYLMVGHEGPDWKTTIDALRSRGVEIEGP